MEPNRTNWKPLIAAFVLLFTLVFPVQFALAFLVQGLSGVTARQVAGIPAIGIEPVSGGDAVRVGWFLLVASLLCAFLSFVGFRYSLQELRKKREV
jgi:hypothetical protein